MAYHPFRHLGLKFVALALATLMWLTVAGEHIVERIVRIPVEFRNIPVNLEVVGDPPGNVDVRIRGSSAVLSRLAPGEVVAVLDLGHARPGARLFHIQDEDVRSPYGVEVTQIVPGTLEIEFERSARRTVPIVAPLEGDPAPGFVVGPVTAEPSTVELAGPESRLRKLAHASTEPVSIAGAQADVRDVVAVGVDDDAVRLLKPQNVTVIVAVQPAPVERELARVLIRPRNAARNLRPRIVPAHVTVVVRGALKVLAGTPPEAIDAFVDLDGLGAGRYNLRVQVDPSQQYGVTAIRPHLVDVTIR